MTIKSTGSLSFLNDIESEFGSTITRSLGGYRSSDSNFQNKNVGSLSNLSLDDGIPTSGEIKFSDFYGKKLNLVVDYYSDGTEIKQTVGALPMSAVWRYAYQPTKVKVVGGFRTRPDLNAWEDGKRVIVNVNKTIGGNKDGDAHDVALRTGDWPGGTELQVDIGSSGKILGAGGDGGDPSQYVYGSLYNTDESLYMNGKNGTSALGVEYPAVINNNGVLRCGFGGGGGGSGGASNPDSGDTDYGRTGSGGGGGAGLPVGEGGAASLGSVPQRGSFNPDANGQSGVEGTELAMSYNGKAGEDGTISTGGSGGAVTGYTNPSGTLIVLGGKGGNGGDENDAAQEGGKAFRYGTSSTYNDPKDGGLAGNNGKSIYYVTPSVRDNSTLIGSEVGGTSVVDVVGAMN